MSELHAKIPNNVELSSDRKLQRALERWQPDFLDWWTNIGPIDFQKDQIYLRTAISVEAGGWAHFSHVKMPDYRWGIFLTPPTNDRKVHFGDRIGEDVWTTVPGEYRKELRRIIVTQGDTEPASVEQQRMLGHCAPSLYDLRNLFQVNVEEGRHLWAMVYLLHTYFGRDGREEAEDMLMRRSGSVDSPRILTTFNEPIDDWLSFFCFTMFTDRDGKYQLAALAESAFEPLARSTQFMLTEEAHHLFVGETGIDRIIKRSAELMREAPSEDVRNLGAIPLDVIQRYINFWYSSSLDLFGGEDSSNAAAYFAAGLKGRYQEAKRYTDNTALNDHYVLEVPNDDGSIRREEIPLRRAMNAVLRDSYAEDCVRALSRWNKTLKTAGHGDLQMYLPSQRFNRKIGIYAGIPFDPHGELMTQDAFDKKRDDWLPTADDRTYVQSLMKGCFEPGVMANWIAAPKRGINGKPIDYDYVRFED